MSCVLILTPVVVASWPVISVAVVSAAASMGYCAATAGMQQREEIENNQKTVKIELDNSQVIEEAMSRGQKLVFTKENVTLTIERDVRGKLSIHVNGLNRTNAELKAIGNEIVGRIIQQFVYNKVMQELKKSDLSVVDQEVMKDDTIKIKLRCWK